MTMFLWRTASHMSVVLFGLTQASASSGDAWAKLEMAIRKAELACISAYRKENVLAQAVKPSGSSEYTASYILVKLDSQVVENAKTTRKQDFCIVSRRTGKPELAGSLP